jgi:hypothetical protein
MVQRARTIHSVLVERRELREGEEAKGGKHEQG